MLRIGLAVFAVEKVADGAAAGGVDFALGFAVARVQACDG